MTINFQRLNDVVKATELLPLGRFDMRAVHKENSCGTAGCMIGNYNAMVGRHPDEFGYCYGSWGWFASCGKWEDWKHFGISAAEYSWIFSVQAEIGKWESAPRDLSRVTREEALGRLRKFIAYKRRKHEMIYDPKYGVKESARRAEGNQCFVMLAVADAQTTVALATAT